jgi:hypothetical protein
VVARSWTQWARLTWSPRVRVGSEVVGTAQEWQGTSADGSIG